MKFKELKSYGSSDSVDACIQFSENFSRQILIVYCGLFESKKGAPTDEEKQKQAFTLKSLIKVF